MTLFSYELEKQYYSKQWPVKIKPYTHLERYLSSWINPIEVFKGKTILDIGAGECEYTRLIADRFEPKEIIACDLFPERMRHAQIINQNPKLKFVVGDCFALPFSDRYFDVVFGSLVLHQLPNLEDALKEINRVLKHPGKYVGFEPNPFNMINIYRHFFAHHSPNQYLFWPWKVCKSFKKAGFEVTICYFFSKLKFIRSKILSTCMGLIAETDV